MTTTYAAIVRGLVSDSTTGHTLAGVTIAVKKTNRGAVTDSRGNYFIKNVPKGVYILEVRSVGYGVVDRTIRIDADDQIVTENVMVASRAITSSEVIVEARANRESAASARNTERTAPSVVSVLSAEEIARYPDPSTAEAMQRVPGVSITRVRGEARDAIIRGMEARYNNTLIDGMKVPSPATNTRVVQLDFLPSELLQRVEVTKSLTADMEGDAIGGTVNLVMRSAPEKFLMTARLGSGYSAPFFTHDFTAFRTDSIHDDPLKLHGDSYRATPSDFPTDNLRFKDEKAPPGWIGEFTIGGRLLENRLGLLVALDGQQIYQRSEVVHNYEAIDPDNNTYVTNKQYRYHSQDKNRYGLNAKADYIVDEHNELDLSFVGFWRQNREARVLMDTGLVSLPQVQDRIRSVFQNHTLADVSLSGTHRTGSFNIHWKGAVAEARQFKPDRAELFLYQNILSSRPDSFVVGPPTLNAIVHDWQENTDRDLYGNADVTWSGLNDEGLLFKVGGLYRVKTRSNSQNEYRLESRIDTTTGGNLPIYTSLDNLDLEVRNTGGTPTYGNNNYTCGENVGAAYAMGTWQIGDLRAVAGVRMEQTDGHYETYDINSVSQLSSQKTYVDVLPSLHLQYAFTQEQNLRLSVGQSISRPSFYDLVPYNTILEDDRVAGNPYLNRTLSTNVDARYEIYPGGSQQLSFGAFYKYIEDPIERTIDISTPSLPTISAKNLGNATDFGFELVGGVSLLEWFYLQVNYTWTHSSITSDKVLFDRASGDALLVPQTRPLQGQAEHVANIALAFTEPDLGIFAQLSLVYTGRRLYQVSLYKDHDDYLESYPLLDFSVEQKLFNSFSLFIRLNNLLNSAWEIREQNQSGKDGEIIERETYGQAGSIGVTFRY